MRPNNSINIGKSANVTPSFHIPNNKSTFDITVNGPPNHYHCESVKLWYEAIL